MPFIDEPVAPGFSTPIAEPKPEPRAPTTEETFGAAFSMENDVANAIELMSKPVFEKDKTSYDWITKLQSSPYWADYKENFVGTRSETEYNYRVSQIEKERQDRETLARSGFTGTVAMIAAGAVSPTLFLPFIGEEKGLAAIGRGLYWGMVGGILQEAPLRANQETRTLEESAVSIGSSTLLSGILGGAAAFLRPAERARIEADMAVKPRSITISPQSAGAAANVVEHAGGVDRGPGGIAGRVIDVVDSNALTRSPVTVNLNGESRQFSFLTAQYADAGLSLEGNKLGIPTTPGGTIENAVQRYNWNHEQAVRSIDEQYAKYYFEGDVPKVAPNIRASVQGYFDKTKLSKDEFRQEVGRAMYANDTHENPFVQTVAAEIRKTVYEPLLKELQAVGLLKDEIGLLADPSYINRVFATDLIRADRKNAQGVGFRDFLKNNFQSKLEADFSKKLEKFNAAQAQRKDLVEDVQRPEDEIAALRKEFTEKLKALETGRNETLEAIEDEAAVHRAQARAIKGDSLADKQARKDLLDKARGLEQFGGEDLAKLRSDRAGLRRRLRNLNKAQVVLEKKHARKLEKIERAEELSTAALNRVAKKGQKILNKIDDYSDKELDAQLSTLKTQFEEVARVYDKGEERIAALSQDEGIKDLVAPTAEPVAPMAPVDMAFPEKTARQDARQRVMNELAPAKRDALHVVEHYANMLPKGLDEKFAKALTGGADEWDEFHAAWDLWAGNKNVPKEFSAAVEDLDLIYNSPIHQRKIDERVALMQKQHQQFVEEYRKIDTRVLEDWIKAARETPNDPTWGRTPYELEVMQKIVSERRRADVGNQNIGGATGNEATIQAGLIETGRQEVRADKMTNISEQIADAEDLGRDALRSLIRDALDETISKVDRINSRRAVRTERLRGQAAKMAPEDIEARVKAIEEEGSAKAASFNEQVRTAGADSFDAEAGTADFSRFASEASDNVVNKILGTFIRLPTVDVMQDLRGATLTRVLDIPSADLAPWLEHDVEKLVRSHIMTMGPDIEIARKFKGTVNMDEIMAPAWDEMKAAKEAVATATTKKGKPLSAAEKERRTVEIDRKYQDYKKNLIAIHERLRHTWGLPTDPDGVGYRLGKLVSNLNVLRYMGMVTASSIPDMAQPILKYGIGHVFREAFVPMISNFKAFRMSAREAKYAGVANDAILNLRAQSVLDITDDLRRGSKFERGVDFATSRQGMLAGFNAWTDIMKQFTAVSANAKIMDSIARVMKNDDKKAGQYLAEVGIGPQEASAIWEQALKTGGSDKQNGVWLPNTEAWDNGAAQRFYRSALAREVNRTIVTPGVERPLWTNATQTGRLLAQFKSFTFASTQRVMMVGLQQRDAKFATGMVASMSLGAMSYYLSSLTSEDAYNRMIEASPERWADEAVARSGMLAVFGIGQDLLSRIPVTAPYSSFSGARTTRRGGDDLLESILGPTYGDFATKATDIVTGIDDPTQSTLHKFRQLLPYQNLIWFRSILDQIEKAAPLPERRQ